MKKAIDSLQVDIPPPRCGPLLTRAAFQILVNSAEPHARSIAAADLAAGNFAFMLSISPRTFVFTPLQ